MQYCDESKESRMMEGFLSTKLAYDAPTHSYIRTQLHPDIWETIRVLIGEKSVDRLHILPAPFQNALAKAPLPAFGESDGACLDDVPEGKAQVVHG